MKKAVFKYFDEFYDEELVYNSDSEDNKWIKNSSHSLGYDMGSNILFYENILCENIHSIYGVKVEEFRKLLIEWFSTKYNLPVKSAI